MPLPIAVKALLLPMLAGGGPMVADGGRGNPMPLPTAVTALPLPVIAALPLPVLEPLPLPMRVLLPLPLLAPLPLPVEVVIVPTCRINQSIIKLYKRDTLKPYIKI